MELQLGYWFRLSQPMRLAGFRMFQNTAGPTPTFGMIWSGEADNPAPTTPLWWGMPSTSQILRGTTVAGWHNYYVRPWHLLPDSEDLQLSIWFQSIYTQTAIDGLLHDITAGPVTLLGQLDHNERGGAYRSGFSMESPPNNTGGNLYGVDLILLPTT